MHARTRMMLRWAFYSPRNLRLALVGVVGALFVLMLLSSLVATLLTSPHTAAAGVRARPEHARIEPTAPATVTVTVTAHPSASATPAATAPTRKLKKRARAFVRAWLRTGHGWEARMRAYVQPDLLPLMGKPDLPHAHLGSVEVTDAETWQASTAVHLTNGTDLTVLWARVGDEWQVTHITDGGAV